MTQADEENGAGGGAAGQNRLQRRSREEYVEMNRVKQARRAHHVAEWSKLDLRQDWPDEARMVDSAHRAGIMLPNRLEPATVKRLQRYARRMGILQSDLPRLVGFRRFQELIEANPRYPLWALICHLAEVHSSWYGKRWLGLGAEGEAKLAWINSPERAPLDRLGNPIKKP